MPQLPKYIKVNSHVYRLVESAHNDPPITKERIAEALELIGRNGVAGDAVGLVGKLPDDPELLNEVYKCVDWFEEIYSSLAILLENLGKYDYARDEFAQENAVDTVNFFWQTMEKAKDALSKIPDTLNR